MELYIAGRRTLEQYRAFICFALLSGGCKRSRRAGITAVIKIVLHFSAAHIL